MPQDKSTEKRLLQLAGEYAVAVQMALRGWHPSLTVGNFPEIDIVAYKPETGKRVTVQVKTARKRDWPVGKWKMSPEGWKVWGFAKADVYVLVHLPDADMGKAEFFVITTERLKNLCEEVVATLWEDEKKRGNGRTGNVRLLPWWEKWKKVKPQAWEGFLAHKDRWELLDEVAK